VLALLYWLRRKSFAGTGVLARKKVICWYCCTGYEESYMMVLLYWLRRKLYAGTGVVVRKKVIFW